MGQKEKQKKSRKVGIFVAHPDDETLWAGGSILMHPEWKCFIFTLCRRSDPDRFRRFFEAVKLLKAGGKMGDLDDGPDQRPLDETNINKTIINLIRGRTFDLLITHSPRGEYTRHRRHEEIGKALLSLWGNSEIQTKEMWFFAYEDGQGAYLPHAERNAHRTFHLPKPVWERKYYVITDIYGFSLNSWEAQTSPKIEAFWCFDSPKSLNKWFLNKEKKIENIGPL